MKNKIIILSFILVLMFFSIYSFILKDEKISYSERRKLEQVPKISIESVFSGTYTKKLNDYFTDQFPLRDYFRKLKGTISNKIFNKNENNGVFIKEDTIYQLDENINEKSIHHFTELLKKLEEIILKLIIYITLLFQIKIII